MFWIVYNGGDSVKIIVIRPKKKKKIPIVNYAKRNWENDREACWNTQYKVSIPNFKSLYLIIYKFIFEASYIWFI